MIRPSISTDITDLARNMRWHDRLEVDALSGLTPEQALAIGFFHSDLCMTGVGADGEVVAMFGVVPLPEQGVGSVWLLSTNAIGKHARALLEHGPTWLMHQHVKYTRLTNMVTADNALHIRLLKRLGFTFGEPIDNFGPCGVRAIPFERTP